MDGLQFDKGYISPYFITDPQEMECVLEDAYILIHEKKISNVRALLPILEQVLAHDRAILIIAEEVENEALAALVVNRLRGRLKVCAVKAPGFGDRRKQYLGDIAVLTGGTFVSEESGLNLENLTLAQLGHAKKIVIDKDNTTLVEGGGKKSAVQERIAQIRHQVETVTSDYDKEKLQERLAKLTGGVAIVHVGAETETALKEKKDRVEDALHATRAAVEEGNRAGRRRGAGARARGARRPPAPGRPEVRPRRGAQGRRVPAAPDRGQRGPRRQRRARGDAGAEGFLRPQRADRRVGRPREDGHHRPDQGHALGAAECGLDRGLMLTTETVVTEHKDEQEKVEGAVS